MKTNVLDKHMLSFVNVKLQVSKNKDVKSFGSFT